MLLDERLPLTDALLFVSGRTAYEIVQKALLAGIPLVAAVSAPSSLAVDLAQEAGITLAGFVRGDRFNIYTHRERIAAMKPTTRRWVSLAPQGIGQQKPYHYGEMLRVAWENRDELPFAWRILRDGVCDGCALGTSGLRDWTHPRRPPVHGAARAAAPQHRARARRAAARRRRRASTTLSSARAARARPPARADGAAPRRARLLASIDWDEALDLVAGAAARRRSASASRST